MEIFSRPGSLSAYARAKRPGLPPPSDCPKEVSAASYDNNKSGIAQRKETVAPFDTTEIRGELKLNGIPSPSTYYPHYRDRREYGTPLIGATVRFKDEDYCNDSPGPIYKIPDPWAKMLRDIHLLNTTKKPRVQYEKFVSNNVPTVFHPFDIHFFVKGIDGRMYPWWRNRCNSPGPKYNVYGIYTSQHHGPYEVDFTRNAKRPPIFKIIPGFGPADFDTRLPRNYNGGIFLSKTDDPKISIPRLFDMLVCHSRQNDECSPSKYYPKGAFDLPCPKAVTAPFKSTAPRLACFKNADGPGPADYFENKPRMQDVDPPLIGYRYSYPPEKAPFDTTEERFFSTEHYEQQCRPAPCEYNIYGFTDWMGYYLCRHAPAVINPKLGFLSSAEARPNQIFKETEMNMSFEEETIPGKWQNIRPKRIKTYSYFGSSKDDQTPGPLSYDTRPGYEYLKGKKSWWNPRDFTGSAFTNSGCGRKTKLANIDLNIPGPKYGTWLAFPGEGGRVTTTEPRFNNSNKTDSPGPRHKLHQKMQSIWRGSQLGTFNVCLKGIGRVRPSAGGFQPYGPLDALADKRHCFLRVDDYADELNPPTVIDEVIRSKEGRKRNCCTDECGSLIGNLQPQEQHKQEFQMDKYEEPSTTTDRIFY